nr:zonadhesin-like 1 [Yponomeuta cagnagella]
MERKLVLVFVIFMSHPSVGAQKNESQNVTCGPNEVEVKCPKVCPTDFCPTSANQNQTCYEQTCNPNAIACECAFNYRRAKNGTCIKTEDCPPFSCGVNERYVACPPYCPTDSCADVKYKGQCPYKILIRLECFPKCQCREGYARDNGTCVSTFACRK